MKNYYIFFGESEWISEYSTHYYLPHGAYIGQKSGQNTMKEWSEHKIKAIFNSTSLKAPVETPCLALSMNFNLLNFFFFFLEVMRMYQNFQQTVYHTQYLTLPACLSLLSEKK